VLKKFIAIILVLYLGGVLVATIVLSQCASYTPEAPDFAAIEDTSARKEAFFGYFKPLAIKQNTIIRGHRERLVAMQEKLDAGKPLNWRERNQLAALARSYELDNAEDASDLVDELLLRADTIPPAMVLAQAANESAWGRSRFARNGNNYFGQWCYRKGCGMVPNRRSSGARHEVQTFSSPEASVRAYFQNINTHPAYKDLRRLRAALRDNDQTAKATQLVAGLQKYSEKGQDYIDELRSMIKVNNLE